MPRFKIKNENPSRFIRFWRKLLKINLKKELIARKFDGKNARQILSWMYAALYIPEDVIGLSVEGRIVKPGEWVIQGEKYSVWNEKKLFKLYDEVPVTPYDDELDFATNGMSEIY